MYVLPTRSHFFCIANMKLTGDNAIKCHLCGKEMKLKEMRSHVGRHIILVLRGVDEKLYLLPGVKV
jgi:hypothetical protein